MNKKGKILRLYEIDDSPIAARMKDSSIRKREDEWQAPATEPIKMVKAFKLFRVDPNQPGKLFPLFVDATKAIPLQQWYSAKTGAMSSKKGKVKSKIGDLAFRPGWHGGDSPMATHIGNFNEKQNIERAKVKQHRLDIMAQRGIDPKSKDAKSKKQREKLYKEFPFPDWATHPTLRGADQVWAEVLMADDTDWQSEANKRGLNKQGKITPVKAHITDQLPSGGHYRYKTNANMTGNWLISGELKILRVLTDEEVHKINSITGVHDLARLTPVDIKALGF